VVNLRFNQEARCQATSIRGSLVLMIFPYFVSNTVVLVIIGVVLMVIPYFVR